MYPLCLYCHHTRLPESMIAEFDFQIVQARIDTSIRCFGGWRLEFLYGNCILKQVFREADSKHVWFFDWQSFWYVDICQQTVGWPYSWSFTGIIDLQSYGDGEKGLVYWWCINDPEFVLNIRKSYIRLVLKLGIPQIHLPLGKGESLRKLKSGE